MIQGLSKKPIEAKTGSQEYATGHLCRICSEFQVDYKNFWVMSGFTECMQKVNDLANLWFE